MFIIEEILTKKQMKEFVDFKLKLYKNCKQFVPRFYNDEVNLNNPKKNPSFAYTESKFWLCRNEKGEVVGRTAAILQPEYNKKSGKRYMRFTRLDFYDNEEIVNILVDTVVDYALEKGMELVHGPLGYDDFDTEGMVVSGFQYPVTFSVAGYNYSYYPRQLERLGFVKEADWQEYRVIVPSEIDKRYVDLGKLVARRYNLHEVVANNISARKVIEKYGMAIFKLLNECYSHLHGFVTISDEMARTMIESFKIAVDARYLSLIADENDNLVALGVMLPSLAKGIKKCNGKLFPFGFIPVLKSMKHPQNLEAAFIAITDKYKSKGVNAMIFTRIIENAIEAEIPFAESNCILDDNSRMQAIWAKFDSIKHRRRRCYVLDIEKYQKARKLRE